MLTRNQLTNLILVVLMIINLSFFIIDLKTNQPGLYIAILNFLVSLTVIIYWIQNQILIKSHLVKSREIVVLCYETIIVAFATYLFFSQKVNNWQVVIQYIFFSIHLIALIGFTIFIFKFKIKRLI